MYDILIKNGIVIDGTGEEMRKEDVGIQDGTIVTIGDLSYENAHKTVDASGKYIVPGFIDVNNHSDVYWKLFRNPTLDSMLRQGVTTIIGGNSGSSLAPLLEPEMIKSVQKWTDVSSVNIDWHTMKEFMNVIDQQKLSLNFATLVGHSTLRRAMIHDEQRELTDEELDVICRMLDEAMQDGAVGLSIALLYSHARTATHRELIRMTKIVKKHNGVCVVYLPDELDGLMHSLEDVIVMAAESGVRVHISHLKAVGVENWPLMKDALQRVEKAQTEGVDISFDVYPYTVMSAVLYTLLPQWVTDNGRSTMLNRLRDEDTRNRVVKEMKENLHIDFGSVTISVSPIIKSLSHHRVSDIATEQGQSPEEVLIDLLLASNGHVVVLLEALDEKGLRKALQDSYSIVASNGGGYSENDWQTGEAIHPRSFGAFARLFEKYVYTDKILSLEQAVMKVSSLPAKRFNISRRGVVAKDMIADITIFDQSGIKDCSTIDQPYRYAVGVDMVIVGGEIAFHDGDMPDKKSGKVLRHNKKLI